MTSTKIENTASFRAVLPAAQPTLKSFLTSAFEESLVSTIVHVGANAWLRFGQKDFAFTLIKIALATEPVAFCQALAAPLISSPAKEGIFTSLGYLARALATIKADAPINLDEFMQLRGKLGAINGISYAKVPSLLDWVAEKFILEKGQSLDPIINVVISGAMYLPT